MLCTKRTLVSTNIIPFQNIPEYISEVESSSCAHQSSSTLFNITVCLVMSVIRFNLWLTGNCSAGYHIDGTNCIACPLGTYQPRKWQDSCIECPEGSTTSYTASTSQDDCNGQCWLTQLVEQTHVFTICGLGEIHIILATIVVCFGLNGNCNHFVLHVHQK